MANHRPNLVDVETYEPMQDRLRVLESVTRGERAELEGRMLDHDARRERLGKWLD